MQQLRQLLRQHGIESEDSLGQPFDPYRHEALSTCNDPAQQDVGAGNSAGQAAVFLAGRTRKVFLLVRGDDLYKSMSSYLAQRIGKTPNIEVLCTGRQDACRAIATCTP